MGRDVIAFRAAVVTLALAVSGVPGPASAALQSPPEPPAASTSMVTLTHVPVECLVAGRLARITTRAEPLASVADVRLLFKGPADTDWYSVAMRQEGDAFQAVLPRPTRALSAVLYVIEARDAFMVSSRTPEATAAVSDAAGCHGRVTAAGGRGPVVIDVPAGQPSPVPSGFSADDAIARGEEKVEKVGVFPGLTPGTALGAALGVGALAVAAALGATSGEVPPGEAPVDNGGPVIQLVGATPAPGSVVHVAVDTFSLRFQIFWARMPADTPRGGTLRVSLYQGAAGASPMCGFMSRGFFGPQPGEARVDTIEIPGPPVPVSCGTSFSVQTARLTVENSSGRVFLSSGTPDFPDLALPYTFQR